MYDGGVSTKWCRLLLHQHSTPRKESIQSKRGWKEINIFTIYISLFGLISVHLLSILFVIISFLSGILLTRRFKIVDSIIYSLLMCQIGNFLYEISQILILSTVGRDLGSLTFYGDVLILLSMFAWYLNRRKIFLHFNWWTLVCFLAFICSLGMMIYSGWFVAVWNWSNGNSVDPHNWLWAISKLSGFMIPVSLLKRNKPTSLFQIFIKAHCD